MLDEKTLLVNLRELASRELQEEYWLFNTEGKMSTPVEAVCGFFDDAGVNRALKSGYLKKNFSVDLYRNVKLLHKMVRFIDSNYYSMDIVDMINHPKMEEIRSFSKELLELFENELARKLR